MELSKPPVLAEEIDIGDQEFSWVRSLVRALVFVAVLTGGLLIIFLSPLKEYLGHYREITQQLAHMGMAAPALFVLGVAVLVFMGVPRLILCFIGGMAFGFFWGLLWSQIGTSIGFYAAFLFVRWGGRDLVLRCWPKLGRLAQRFKKHSLPAVILIRQLPVNGIFINLLLGLLPIRQVDYLLGTAIGILPEAIPCTLIGSGMGQSSLGKGLSYITGAMALLIVFWLFCGLLVRARRNKDIVL